MRKSIKVIILTIVICLAFITPVVYSKSTKFKISAKGVAKTSQKSMKVQLKGNFNLVSDDPKLLAEGAVVLRAQTEDDKKIFAKFDKCHIMRSEEGDSSAPAFIVEINGQLMPVNKVVVDGKTRWITQDFAYIMENGNILTLNLVWRFQVEIQGLTAGV
jgi:hypothetical protein